MASLGSEKLREYRKREGLSLRTMGERIEASYVSVREWERGDSEPKIPVAVRIATATGGEVPVESWALPGKGVAP